ncbi:MULTISPECIES: nuclease-related domain-containing protein [Allobacillus]|uniref:NERD domain-containing protein n=1 Tax=Allobacillus salarius TaxID=1955272 RepID=A0A556PDK2_9BACI|nr:nuclease-related domain-containing protein [Allobacillus salarius]TSJ62467.1 NERD domain-containing protein [Allobacillus salarius]
MIYNERSKPLELLQLEVLAHRTTLSPKEQSDLVKLKKGFEGERLFDFMLEGLSKQHLQVNDLLLTFNGTVFQIDTLLITQDKIFVYEVKNFDGEFIYEQEKYFKYPQQEIQNPLHQIARSTSLLTQLIRKLGFNWPIQSYVIFVNKNFTLFNAPPNTSMILPTQIGSHLEYLQTIPSHLNRVHKRLAEKLIERHLDESPFQKKSSYSYDQVKKGCFVENAVLPSLSWKEERFTVMTVDGMNHLLIQ